MTLRLGYEAGPALIMMMMMMMMLVSTLSGEYGWSPSCKHRTSEKSQEKSNDQTKLV